MWEIAPYPYYWVARAAIFPYNISMNKLDLRGMTCPAPVVETKKLLDEKRVDEIEILLDDDIALENVTRFLSSQGFSVASEKADKPEGYVLKGLKMAGAPGQTVAPTVKLLVFLNSATIGRGDDELGRVLMGLFLNTLKGLGALPWRIVLINGGVKLVAAGSEYVNVLTELEGLGTEILSCGTCLDFFNLKNKVAVGKITNMYEIASSFLEAGNVIQP